MASTVRRFLVFLLFFLTQRSQAQYLIGSGHYDVTGPPADIMMMGYVDPKQTTQGISSRLRSRAFVIVDDANQSRVVLLTLDETHVYESLIQKLVEKLKFRFGSLYTEKNILAQATHTHSSPGGVSHYTLYSDLSSLGYSEQNFNAIVEGMYQSIVRAHENIAPGKILISRGKLEGLGINRSPEAYLLNPKSERARYSSNTDKDMTVLKFERTDGTEIGLISWFALHATNMKKSNRLISGDNKGYAEYLFEKAKGTNYFMSDTFVAAFPSSNAGDVSPSDGVDSDGNKEWDCDLGDQYKCTERAGMKQYLKARELYDSADEEVTGSLDFRHRFVDFSKVAVKEDFADGKMRFTCYSALGTSMLAGTEDGRGVGREGQTCSHPNPVTAPLCLSHFCHGEKPVVIATGLKQPYPWSPQILPISIIQLGQLALIAVPAEFTTMSGRRTRETIEKILKPIGVRYSVLAGYANGYAGYVATPEEYQRQDYEGASTHFGQWTLPAYQQELSKLATALVEHRGVVSEIAPPDLSSQVRDNIPRTPPLFDAVPKGAKWGSLKTSPKDAYLRGETVIVEFWSSYPNRNLLTQSSYLEVQKKQLNDWKTIKYDWDFDTKYIWNTILLNHSVARIEWNTHLDTEVGTYRILHRGFGKSISSGLSEFSGLSPEFKVK